jgi:MATE family multidrug resistance protein
MSMYPFSEYSTHYKQIIRLGVPIMLGQLGIIITGFADNIMVGHHSMEELAAASFVNNFFTLASIFGMGFSYGLTPVVSIQAAQDKPEQVGETLKNGLFINFITGIGITLIMAVLLLNLERLNQPKELYSFIIPYYTLQLASIPFVMLFNAFKQFSDGIGDTVTPMWILLGSNFLNIVGNFLLIYGHGGFPEMGLYGAGIATLAARILCLLVFIGIFLSQAKYRIYRFGFKKAITRPTQALLLKMGLPVGIQMGVESGSFSLSVLMMGWLGSIALAAHQIVCVVTTIGFMIYYGIGAAVAIRVSMCKGQNDLPNIRRSAFAGLHLMMCLVVTVMLIIWGCRHFMGFLFTDNIEVVHLAAVLAIPVVLYQIGDGLQILYANALRGIGDVKFLAYSAFICHFGLALPIGYLCGFVLDWGPLGIWCGFPFSLTLLGLVLGYRFNKKTPVSSNNKLGII